MRDLSLNNFADELYDRLQDKGSTIPRWLIRKLTKKFFTYVEKIAEEGKDRFIMYSGGGSKRPISSIYPKFDVVSLCNELAMNERFVLTADYLVRKKKLQKRVARHIKKKTRLTINSIAA